MPKKMLDAFWVMLDHVGASSVLPWQNMCLVCFSMTVLAAVMLHLIMSRMECKSMFKFQKQIVLTSAVVVGDMPMVQSYDMK
jgi:hypothetical protein